MKNLEKLTNDKGIITALAIDQRGALKRMLGEDASEESISEFKTLVSESLTPFASSILLDPEYGINAANQRDNSCGLILAYEQTGYDKQEPGRLPDLIPDCSVKNLKEDGADAIKLLIYVDIDEPQSTNQQKEAFVERVGSECLAEDVPFFLEIVTYDDNIGDEKGYEFAKIKPHKVNNAMKKYSESRFNVDVLKVEVPINMNYVEGYSENEVAYSKEEAKKYFEEQSKATPLPFIFLSAGVSPDLFQETLKLANNSNSGFNGVLCGRATWSGATECYRSSNNEATEWLENTGIANIKNLNSLVNILAKPIN